MSEIHGFPNGWQDFYYRGGLGLGCTSPETIGQRGRCSGVVLCIESRKTNGSVGRWLAWSQTARVQFGHGQNRACRARYGERGGRAGVALRRGLDAMHDHVLHVASVCVCAWEHVSVLSALWACSALTEHRTGVVYGDAGWQMGIGW
jgi:hypothetical protein